MDILTLSLLTLVTVLAETFGAGAVVVPLVTFGVLAVAGYSLANLDVPEPTWISDFFHGMLASDATGQRFSAALLAVAGLWFVGFHRSLTRGTGQPERVVLALVALIGGLIACRFQNLLCLYLGLETLSIPLYILAGTQKHHPQSFEASLKYFFLSAFFSTFRVLGIVLWYGATGSFDLFLAESRLAVAASSGLPVEPLLATAMLLILAGGLFKVSAVPFHFWAADVYDGAPTPVAAFMMTVGKLAGVGALLRFLESATAIRLEDVWMDALSVVIIATLAAGNLAAAVQGSVKRRLAYSSIANVGFLLMAVGTRQTGVALFFGVTYALATLVTLGVVERLGGAAELGAFDGLGRRRPWLAASMAVALASLAGLPPLPGFFGKYLVLGAAFEGDHWAWVLAGVLGSVISAAYYLEIVARMVFRAPASEAAETLEPSAGTQALA